MKDILILGQGPTQGLDDTTLTAETKYPINFKFCEGIDLNNKLIERV